MLEDTDEFTVTVTLEDTSMVTARSRHGKVANSELSLYLDKKSDLIKINRGVKQGGVHSGHIFNRFMHPLLHRITRNYLGCRLGNINTSVLAYCDEISLQSLNTSHRQKLLNICQDYTKDLRIKFNFKKSVCFSIKYPKETKDINPKFYLNETQLENVEEASYLGLLVGNKK